MVTRTEKPSGFQHIQIHVIPRPEGPWESPAAQECKTLRQEIVPRRCAPRNDVVFHIKLSTVNCQLSTTLENGIQLYEKGIDALIAFGPDFAAVLLGDGLGDGKA